MAFVICSTGIRSIVHAPSFTMLQAMSVNGEPLFPFSDIRTPPPTLPALQLATGWGPGADCAWSLRVGGRGGSGAGRLWVGDGGAVGCVWAASAADATGGRVGGVGRAAGAAGRRENRVVAGAEDQLYHLWSPVLPLSLRSRTTVSLSAPFLSPLSVSPLPLSPSYPPSPPSFSYTHTHTHTHSR